MTHKRKAAPNLYGENKTPRMINLTPTAWENLQKMAKALETSRSELIEQFARGIIPIHGEPQTAQHLGE